MEGKERRRDTLVKQDRDIASGRDYFLEDSGIVAVTETRFPAGRIVPLRANLPGNIRDFR